MNEFNTVKDIMFKIIGEYQATTPPSVSIDINGIDPTTPVSIISNISYGISTLDIAWIFSAILLIAAFIVVMGLIKCIFSTVIR
ncbi:hypothetical protein GKZ28_09095 [Clostridium chromiireducens]|uniref:Uncharacterized protein n=1 Tax=Clostridium chromiireducens TaxID=225345 RepID=A0A964W217_9CLOT|nr:hypothetical protein [Clostridium chromiireducens]MVX63849.1 hypothetical protein [Clostridium chromiireducens]